MQHKVLNILNIFEFIFIIIDNQCITNLIFLKCFIAEVKKG